MRKFLLALSICLALAACNHLSGEIGPTTTDDFNSDQGGNGGGNGGGY